MTERESFGRDNSVQQCLEIMNGVSNEQRARARHLDTKTGTIASFCGAALTLNVTLGRPLLKEHLSPTAETWIKIFFGLAVLSLALAGLVAVAGVLRPMGHQDLDEEQIDAYSDRPKVITDPEDLRMTWLRTVTEMAISDRKAGDAKSRRSNAAVVLLAAGIVGVTGQAATLLIAQ